jgi:hypothetical protein
VEKATALDSARILNAANNPPANPISPYSDGSNIEREDGVPQTRIRVAPVAAAEMVSSSLHYVETAMEPREPRLGITHKKTGDICQVVLLSS